MKKKHLNKIIFKKRDANKASRFFMNFYAGEVRPEYALEKQKRLKTVFCRGCVMEIL